MKGKFVLAFLAMLLPSSMIAQVAAPAKDTAPDFQKYEVYASAAYSGANQVKGSSALVGFDFGADARLKKYFGGAIDFGYYGFSPCCDPHVYPTVTTVLFGPELYVPADNLTGFFHVLIGGAHTGGVGARPNISFATGVGGGFEYTLTKRLAARISGDGIFSSFVEDPNNLGYSPHLRVNARATGGVAYRF